MFRSFWRYKSFTIINLLGLSIGIAAVVTIFMIVDYEKSFDSFHQNGNSVYRIVSQAKMGGNLQYEANVPYPTAKYLRNEIQDIRASQIHFTEDANIRIGNTAPFNEKNVVFADSGFFQVFDFSRIKNFVHAGDPVKALSEPNKAILTQSTAKRYFGSGTALGQHLKIDAKLEVEVAAIIEDIPATTHLPFNMLISYPSLTNDFIGGLNLESWGLRGNGYCYVRTDQNSTVKATERALYSIVQKYSNSDREKQQTFYLQSLRQIHFDPTFDSTNPGYTVSSRYLTMLLLLGGFIIFIACINYINLSTSLAFTKSKEVGIRKTIGASKSQLFFYYISETYLLTLLSTIAGYFIVILALPAINLLLDKSISAEQLISYGFLLWSAAGIIVVGFISGVYPAIILSGFKPMESLKNKVVLPGKSSTLLRKGLVIFQFTTSIALIICTLVIAKQLHYFSSKFLGFNKDAVVEVGLPSPDSTKIAAFKSLLQNQAGIQRISFCVGAPISDNSIGTSMKAAELSDQSDHSVKIIACDSNYLATYGLQLLAGRWFLPGEEKNLGSSLVVTEALVKTLGYKNPSDAIGKKVSIGINEYNPSIIGVVRNFHTSSLHEQIKPVALMPFPLFYYAAAIRVNSDNMRSSLSSIASVFKSLYPDYVFNVNFVDEHLARLYAQDTRNYTLFKAFSGISIFICCIGLWGLLAFVVVRKTKEIGIRKVLGATVTNIVALLSKEFIGLVIIALLMAAPIAFYFMQQWLQNFAYRIPIPWWLFVVAGLFAIIMALFTISFQAVKAALSNPVKNLRTE